ncbi:hypothetical protein WI77_07950 [Burkholderia ubonensis]|nr:hypothetical protein WI77_07950 [Burkholderia ubonensis]
MHARSLGPHRARRPCVVECRSYIVTRTLRAASAAPSRLPASPKPMSAIAGSIMRVAPEEGDARAGRYRDA